MCYQKRTGVKQDYVEVVKWFMKEGNQGDASAQYRVAF